MTHLVLDPALLAVLFPRASHELPVRVRIFGQILEYSPEGVATLCKAPGMPSPDVVSLEESQGPTESSLVVWLGMALETLQPGDLEPGSVVSVTGFYNGDGLDVVDCTAVNGAHLSAAAISTMHRLSQVQKLRG